MTFSPTSNALSAPANELPSHSPGFADRRSGVGEFCRRKQASATPRRDRVPVPNCLKISVLQDPLVASFNHTAAPRADLADVSPFVGLR
jgi:hypothetical protein